KNLTIVPRFGRGRDRNPGATGKVSTPVNPDHDGRSLRRGFGRPHVQVEAVLVQARRRALVLQLWATLDELHLVPHALPWLIGHRRPPALLAEWRFRERNLEKAPRATGP